MASVRSVDDALGITLSDNGRILRNIIHGADTVMSHILHFYHLAAVDFIEVTALGGPWGPSWGTLNNATCMPVTVQNIASKCIVLNYVKALDIRRDAHTLGAIFHGRHPIGNAIVPGGASCLITKANVSDAQLLISKIRNFINTAYIVDVVSAATATTFGFNNYWFVGTNPNKLLSYGEYPFGNTTFKSLGANNMLLSSGRIAGVGRTDLDLTQITERVTYSYYSSPDNLHPSAGVTTPDLSSMSGTDKYTWLKAPRYGGDPHEVGPLARVLSSVLNANPTTVSGAGAANIPTANLGAAPITGSYTITQLWTAAAADLNSLLPGAPLSTTNLYSPLGRHATRALECKFIADAMGGGCSAETGGASWLAALTYTNSTDFNEVGATVTCVSFGYTWASLPKGTISGTGLAEAPRGALGHWITVEDKKISRYQCVVPSTWNCGPRHGPNDTEKGVAEQAVIGVNLCSGDPTVAANLNDAVLNAARMLHPYDFCIACAVHLVTPEGKEIAKFKMDTEGKITKYPVDSE
jgi:hydrogenase large subunit